MKNFFEELKRRNVIKAAIAYVVVAWVVLQVISILAPLFDVPEGITRFITVLLFIGFPIWIVFSWVYEATETGVKRTSKVEPGESMSHVINKRLNILIVIMLGVAIAMNFVQRNRTFKTDIQEDSEVLEASIAIIPFDDMSSAGDSQWFCDGVADDILTHLAQISEMKVISRTSSERYKDTQKSVPEIAAELGVNYLVEGSVSIHEGQIMINVQLIDRDDDHIWAEIYREDFKEVFSIRERISKNIADKLKVAISPQEEERLEKIPTHNMEAYELVVRAKNMMGQNEPELRTSIEELLDKAIALDPAYADAYALKAQNYWSHFGSYGISALDEAEKLTMRSLELDPENAIAFINMSIISSIDSDHKKAIDWIDKALRIKPNDAYLNEIAYHAFMSQEMKDTLRAYRHIEKAHTLDPFSISINRTYYDYLNEKGQYKAASDHLKTARTGWDSDEIWWLDTWWKGVSQKDPSYLGKALQDRIRKDPENPQWYRELARYYDWVLNDDDHYLEYSKIAYEKGPDDFDRLSQYINALAEHGDYEKALKILDTLNLERYDVDSIVGLGLKSYVYYFQGDLEQSLKMLDSLPDFFIERRLLVLAQMGSEVELRDFKQKHGTSINPTQWAFYYAIRENRDSMYYYLNHPKINPHWVNSRFEFDPYRNDERYKDFLRGHGFPVPGEYDPSELELNQPRTIEDAGK